MYPDCLSSRLSALPPIDNRLLSEARQTVPQQTTSTESTHPLPPCGNNSTVFRTRTSPYNPAMNDSPSCLPLPSPYSLSLSWNLTGEKSFNATTIYNILETIPEVDYISFLVICRMVFM